MNDHGVYIRDIQPGLYNSSGHQHIDLSVDEIKHDPFQFMLLHLSMGIGHICFRHQFRDLCRNIRNIIHTVIDIVDLSAPGHLPDNSLSDQFVVVFADKSLDRQPVVGSLLQHAHIPDTDEAHVQGTGNRCCRQGQHIHVLF